MQFLSTILTVALLAHQTVAHPGATQEEHVEEARQMADYFKYNKRSLAHCAEKLKARGNDAHMHERRAAIAQQLRAKRSILQG